MKVPEDSPVAVGDILAGKYRVERVLGVGGMGIVVAATHIDLDELRAIKFMRSQARASVEAETRFLREARSSAKLKSEHVVRVHDMGRLDGGEPYLVMEFLEGLDLKAIIKRSQAVAVVQATDYLVQACEALAEAHAAGIIHRDLKPSNLFVTTGNDGRPCIKVLDFGISKLTGALAESSGMDLTQASSVMGSPLYMSPEQMESARDIDARADIWSLGVILYETLTRTRPFSGTTVTAVTMSVAKDDVVPPSKRRPEIPALLELVILRCLEKDRTGRYDDVLELAEALAPFASGECQAVVDRIRRMLHQEEDDPIPPAPDSAPTAVMDPVALRRAAEESGLLPPADPPVSPAPPPPTERYPDSHSAPQVDLTPPPAEPSVDPEAATLCMSDSHGSLSSSDAALAPQIDTGTDASWGGTQYPELPPPRSSGLWLKVAVPIGALCVVGALVFLVVGQSTITSPETAETGAPAQATAKGGPAGTDETAPDEADEDDDEDPAGGDEEQDPAAATASSKSSAPQIPSASVAKHPKPPASHPPGKLPGGKLPGGTPKSDPFGETWR
ncbi:MAG: serine/threonine protein kinase [Deltaproteobacteria bacterium]|nr:serine/threonine protein kinase [Deltaproteobacteria bacterium]